MRSYMSLLRGPAGALLGVSWLGRVGFGISGLAFIVYIQGQTGSFATTGIALGAFGIASGVLAPFRGAAIDRHGRGALLLFVGVYCSSNLAISVTEPIGGGASYVVLNAISGAAAPPFSAWTRAALARRVDEKVLHTAYSLDGVLEESAFVLGPLIAGLIIALIDARTAIIVQMLLALSAGLLLAFAPAVREWRPVRRPVVDRERREWREMNRPLLIAVGSMAGVGMAVSFFDFGVTAFAKEHGHASQAGAVLAAFSAAGVIGALLYGMRSWRWSPRRRYPVLLAAMAVGMALLPLADSVLGLALIALVPGLAFTPVFVTNSVLIDELSEGVPTTAAFAGVTSSVMIGVSLGGAVAGGLVDAHGTDVVFLAGTAVGLLGTLPAFAIGSSAGNADGAKDRG
jgi:predicted MFS family arabinose efflux permease